MDQHPINFYRISLHTITLTSRGEAKPPFELGVDS